MIRNTLNVGRISEGFVLDHIEAGKSMDIYKYLELDKFDCCVAIIRNASSNKMGKKDIMKIECPLEWIDLDVLGYIDHNITINIIQDDVVVNKKRLHLPKEITNIIKCKNPRCITSIEQELDHIFVLVDEDSKVYRCKYCEEAGQSFAKNETKK
jgi:aspartate carbamoyltransferase regulatory subunit